jgi:lipoprotein-anchoring transpeptidase ErfK/SrfK
MVIIIKMKLFSRRDFLKYSSAALAAGIFLPDPSLLLNSATLENGRVATDQVSVYAQADDTSTIIRQLFRDEIFTIYEDVISEKGPGYNPLWHRVWGGYVHSARIQKVETRLNQPLSSVPETGLLTEITVPYTQAYRYTKTYGWMPIYRLYYGSTHWIIGVEEGPDGQPWYRIRDELLAARHENYHAPAQHMRYIQPEEYSPLSTNVALEDKLIEVDIATQTLTAYEGGTEVLHTKISSGLPSITVNNKNTDTDTPRGEFSVFRKTPSKHMGGGYFTDDLDAYILPGVPWASFFVENGVAFHGTWWHNNFGMTMSHGCVNMRTAEALWIYRWTLPVCEPNTVETNGRGTRVVVR